MDRIHKLTLLADAAKYDSSCAGSGAKRTAQDGGIGNTTGAGIYHRYTPDGRCVSLLKILLTTLCIYDCRYCVNRISSDVPRARFSVTEVVELTLDFYRRNYIEGLFLSFGVRFVDCHPCKAARASSDIWMRNSGTPVRGGSALRPICCAPVPGGGARTVEARQPPCAAALRRSGRDVSL